MSRLLQKTGLAIFLLVCASTGRSEPFPPFDDAANDSSFLEFRGMAREIARARNMDRLKEIMSPEILTSFGGNGGIDEAVMAFETDASLWPELERVLSNGGRFTDTNTFAAPYWSLLEVDDPFSVGVVTGENVNVRSAPSATAPTIGALSHETVELVGEDPWESPGWVSVKADGQNGFVSDTFLESPVGHRAIFQRTPEGWKLDAFVAGD